uniref:Uncharacterized protein n=1 Tax=Tanacetum cinerariifolium TaxID=118510 RepID=A0A6L2K3T4_TANCI|nr:hypothetical protein [Tanacetum cinerariifolium]
MKEPTSDTEGRYGDGAARTKAGPTSSLHTNPSKQLWQPVLIALALIPRTKRTIDNHDKGKHECCCLLDPSREILHCAQRTPLTLDREVMTMGSQTMRRRTQPLYTREQVERVEQHIVVKRVLERAKGKVTSCRHSLPPIASYETEKKRVLHLSEAMGTNRRVEEGGGLRALSRCYAKVGKPKVAKEVRGRKYLDNCIHEGSSPTKPTTPCSSLSSFAGESLRMNVGLDRGIKTSLIKRERIGESVTKMKAEAIAPKSIPSLRLCHTSESEALLSTKVARDANLTKLLQLFEADRSRELIVTRTIDYWKGIIYLLRAL